MPLESNLKRKVLDNDNQTLMDYQDTSNNDTFYNLIKFGLAGLTTYAAFKSGALKPIAKSLLELGDNVSKTGADKAASAMDTIKQWSNLKPASFGQIEKANNKNYIANSSSIFRERDSSIFYDIFKDFTELSDNRITNFHNIRKIINDTADDVKLLNNMIKENSDKLVQKRNDYFNTDLYYKMNEITNMRRDLSNKGTRTEELLFTSKSMDDFINRMTLTKEAAAQELKESGYRKLTWGDIFEKTKIDGITQLKLKDNANIDLSLNRNKNGRSFVDEINKFFNENRDTANKSILASDKWKNMIFDSKLRIDANNNIIDYRMPYDNLVNLAHSLSNDFKLPLVQFNPLKSMLQLDKFGRKNPMIGLLSPNQYDPNITRMGGATKIGDWLANTFGEEYANKNVAIINKTAYIVNENNELQKVADNLRLHDITNADNNYGLKPLLNATRQMAGITTGEASKLTNEQFQNLNNFQKVKYKIGEILDMGYHEIRPQNDLDDRAFDTISSIDVFTDELISKIGGSKLFRTNGFQYDNIDDFINSIDRKNFKTMFGDGLEEYLVNGKTVTPRMYTTTKEGFKISNVYNYLKENNKSAAEHELKGFFGQFFVGRNADNTMHEFATERSGIMLSIFNQLNEGLATSASILGFSVNSKKTSIGLAGNLLFKRFLPLYMLTKVPGVINYMSEPFFGEGDETGNRDNITKFLMRNVVKPIDVGAHHAMDLTGVTKLFKFMNEMIPGFDQVEELSIGLGQTKEEREEYIEKGYDPVRKGRWWGSGNTSFSGGKIMYFRPNIYRRVEADVEFSDSKWGSRQEYYNNTWFPNPVNPFAPINHFITNRNHYDKKHYYDRPYLQTAPEGQNIPIIGPLFGATIGRVINPPTKMHKEYWKNGFKINPTDELPSSLLTTGTLDTEKYDNSITDINTYNNIQQRAIISNNVYQNNLSNSAYQAKQITAKKYTDNAGITFEEKSILPTRTYDRYNTSLEVYSTPSGNLSILDVPDEMNLYNVNKDLQNYSISKVIGTKQRVNVSEYHGPNIPVGNDNEAIDNAFLYSLGEQYNWLSDIAGLKGFAVQTFLTGEANEQARVIEDSGYAYSFNNDFWEANLGGLGAGLSEISRRFIPKRNNSTEYVNPIRNTMPSWMPGSNYFTDFKHGDPYSKIDNGEERLPGEGYERLHNIKGLMDFNIGSSSIGYEKDYIIKHMLKADKYKSSFEEDTLEKGNEIHKQIQKSWIDSGLAISTEGEIKDKRNGIIGYYDALVHDLSSRTGLAIVDIKSTSADKIKELKKSGKPLTHHMRQTNYYLWATGNTESKGYIHYVDKENPNNTYTVGFDYSESELKKTLQNVYDARSTIRKAVKTGEIGRGELYSTLDKFRILADVAPYSQEFKDVSAQLSSEDLTAEEQEEASQIRERIKKQKEPLRVYPYKFKTSNLKTETVTVQKIIDNNTIVTKEYGKQHSIKFAGINVSTSNSEKYDDKRTKNEAARSLINAHIRPGSKIKISYDADERNKYSKDSTQSIRAVVHAHGRNLNRLLLDKGHAKEKENDDSPAAIHARYSKGEIAFGSAMETLTHDVMSKIPFVGNKLFQVRSPYEQYRKREVYSKDFQSWNHPIRDMLIPHIEENIANNDLLGLGGILMGGFTGSMFGKSKYGKIIGTVIGASVPAIGKIAYNLSSTKDRAWRPKRRRDQEKLNEYVDTLKYVKNMRLYEQYKLKAKKENNFDVDKFMESKQSSGAINKLKQRELTDYKRKVKLDFKHRDNYNFKYDKPKYVESKMTKKETISAINKELSELQNKRKVTKVPVNALKAIEYKQAAKQTMYGYEPGDSLVNIMTALPKKDRQYFKHFIDAPEEEKQKILRIAPSYLRRALQSTWGMKVDKKPELNEYFQTHGLPDANWIGWDESTNIEDVKVKLIHQNNLDPGEFDVWDNNKIQADKTNIPIPKIDSHNSARFVQMRLNQILGKAGYEDVQTSFVQSSHQNKTSLHIKYDGRKEVEQKISEMDI